ncbi:hypothetical protein BDM02DRAFT_3107315 [Thelephora ganbajun]|uniref:Uncharacterized protein n=1 Tax=Thelephora ganbajun TaxID=370292 RepID=A0ACB6ZX65_THEGA|nr:hypothetical protein BDM02DRAFT_3107315 [Thelephora ganbajun]
MLRAASLLFILTTMSLAPIVELYRWGLQPVAPFLWFGIQISTIEVAAAIRLCLILRQVRELIAMAYKGHATQVTAGASEKEKEKFAAAFGPKFEEKSLVRDLVATLIVVHGGDAIAPLLGMPPPFLVSGVYPITYALIQTGIEWIPTVPDLSLQLELPLSFLDALSRTLLLVHVIPGMVLNSPYPQIASSPWALLVTSLFSANTGFFILNLTNFLHPTPLSLTTPSELLPYGWTTVDLWCAPLVTGVYSLLTHAQPFWESAHATVFGWLSPGDEKLAPVDHETARAACTVVLMVLFSARAVKTYGGMKH